MKFKRVRAESWSKPILLLMLPVLMAVGLQGCQDGVTNSVQPQTSMEQSTYSGPAARTEDIQNFRVNLWENLRTDDRCGTCHNTGGQAPTFVQEDDVNLAYAEATNLVNRSDIQSSRLITKVAAGHNCWLPVDAVCADLLTTFVERWVGTGGVSGNQIVLEAPEIIEVGTSRSFPADAGLFATYVHPLLTAHCSDCHQEAAQTPQSPYFATADANTAYSAVKDKIDLDTPANSRLVLRLQEFHNCWSDCPEDAVSMRTAITNMADSITPTSVDPALVVSKALRMDQGTIASGGSRHETDVIALYEFKAATGNTVFDRSGIAPALNLTLSGDVTWVSGWGIDIRSGKAQGTTTASKKLSDLIKASGEYSIEAWVVPANVTQEGPARIVSYSGGNDIRNFTMGQTQYNYDFMHRSSSTGGNGEPALSTADADEALQATEQHVVMTFDPANGRRIYVNGVFTDDLDEAQGGNLADWVDTYALVLGNEVSGQRQWQGKIRLLAIHNRALTQEQITQNFEVGVGEKYFLLFSVSDLVGLAESYVVFEVSRFDEYSYLFRKPRFISLDASVQPSGIPLAGMRIGINGKEAAIGQAYTHLNEILGDNYTAAEGQSLSSLGTVIPLEKGPTGDEFFLSFERLAGHSHVFSEPAVIPPGEPRDDPPLPEIGLRTFEEIDATMAELSGVPRTDSGVRTTYETIKQQLPSTENINAFLSAHQIGVSQLAIEYCSALVDNTALRGGLFGSFSFSTDANNITLESWRDGIVTPLITRFMGQGLNSQPLTADVQNELLTLLTDPQDNKPYDENGVPLGDGQPDGLARCSGDCGAGRTETATKAACAALLGSAVMLIQ